MMKLYCLCSDSIQKVFSFLKFGKGNVQICSRFCCRGNISKNKRLTKSNEKNFVEFFTHRQEQCECLSQQMCADGNESCPIFVVKKYDASNLAKKKELNLECGEMINVPVRNGDKIDQENYYLRSVVCHTGDHYHSIGHYRCLVLEQFIADGELTTTYHELNDRHHYVLKKRHCSRK